MLLQLRHARVAHYVVKIVILNNNILLSSQQSTRRDTLILPIQTVNLFKTICMKCSHCLSKKFVAEEKCLFMHQVPAGLGLFGVKGKVIIRITYSARPQSNRM